MTPPDSDQPEAGKQSSHTKLKSRLAVINRTKRGKRKDVGILKGICPAINQPRGDFFV